MLCLNKNYINRKMDYVMFDIAFPGLFFNLWFGLFLLFWVFLITQHFLPKSSSLASFHISVAQSF